MSGEPNKLPQTVTVALELKTAEWEMNGQVTVPAGPTKLIQMLPLIQSMTDQFVGAAVQAAEQQGQTISCKKGCGACCRQLVPVSEVEAHNLRRVIETLPEPRRSVVRGRFAEARRRLEAAGLIDELLNPERWTASAYPALGIRYFQQGIACPFLEDESCSIYADRPLKCREFLVMSPAENCRRPTPETVRSLHMPLSLANAVARFDVEATSAFLERWVPLILAPEWANDQADEGPARTGSELLGELLQHAGSSKQAEREGSSPTA